MQRSLLFSPSWLLLPSFFFLFHLASCFCLRLSSFFRILLHLILLILFLLSLVFFFPDTVFFLTFLAAVYRVFFVFFFISFINFLAQKFKSTWDWLMSREHGLCSTGEHFNNNFSIYLLFLFCFSSSSSSFSSARSASSRSVLYHVQLSDIHFVSET